VDVSLRLAHRQHDARGDEGDPIEWMKDALDGKDSTSFKEDIGVCVVIAHGDFPHGNFTKREVSGVPIYGVTKGTRNTSTRRP
jgi:hypothetical protein